jgi:DNA-directed RNA polymerase subunit RPC12/RpoP
MRYDARMPSGSERPTSPASQQPSVKATEIKACPTDLSIQCPTCGTQMQPEHAHYRCLRCGYRDSCCM